MSDGEWETVVKKSEKKKNPHRLDGSKERSIWSKHHRDTIAVVPQPEDDDDASKPTVLLLIGLPGSGKSTFAKELCRILPWKYVRVNQDDMKTRNNCVVAAMEALDQGKSVIVDRCNWNRQQRKHFMNLGSDLDVHCIVFDVPSDVCLKRCQQRRGHPTLPPSKAGYVIETMEKDLLRPTVDEGFRSIRTVHAGVSSMERQLRYLVEESQPELREAEGENVSTPVQSSKSDRI